MPPLSRIRDRRRQRGGVIGYYARMSFPTNDGPPITTPQQFDQLLTRFTDAHAHALKTKAPEDWATFEDLSVSVTDAYARVFNILNQAITEDLRR